MQSFPPTVIWRHRKENLKKCSLRGLESRDDFIFFRYPVQGLPLLKEYFLLDIEGDPLTSSDAGRGIVVLDATWRYASRMGQSLLAEQHLPRRSLPLELVTAYPRRQHDCVSPDSGLASIEAIYATYFILKRPTNNLLNAYYWRDSYLQMNTEFFNGKGT